MKVLVSGGNGFLAGHIVHELIRKQHVVRVMIRPGARIPALDGLKIEVIEGQITDEADLMKAVQDCDAVIHAAADTSQHHRHMQDYFPVNVEATENLIRVMQVQGCRKMIYISTANTMGYGSRDEPGTEDRPMAEAFQKSGYAWSKYCAEERVSAAVQQSTLEAVILNPGFMIGPMDFNPHSGRIFSMILNKRLAFYPPGGKSFADVRDVAQAAVAAFENGRNGERYLLTGTNLSYREFFRLVLEVSRQKTRLIPVPKFILSLAGLVGSLLKSLGFSIELTRTNARILCIRNFYSCAKASSELGYSPRDIRETIGDYLIGKDESYG